MANTERNPVCTEVLIEKLTAYIMSDVLMDATQSALALDDDLLEDGLVDSLGIMRLIAFIEQEFGFAVPPEEVTVESFMSVAAIANYLKPNLAVDEK